MKPRAMHMRSLRLYNNAGISFPLCYAGAALLDMDKGRLASTSDKASVTCKKCQRLITTTRNRFQDLWR